MTPPVQRMSQVLMTAPRIVRVDCHGARAGVQRAIRATCHTVRACQEGNGGGVLLTREAGKNERLAQLLEERGIGFFELPVIETTDAADTERLPAALQRSQFEWIVLTSPEAAAVFQRAWQQAGRPNARLACVGSGTRHALSGVEGSRCLTVAFQPTKANAVHLAAELPKAGSAKVLYPASARARSTLQDGLRARGFEVQRLDTYDTKPVCGVQDERLQRAKCCDVVAIASPSALTAWVTLAGMEHAKRQPIACIGSTSADAALRLGFAERAVFWDAEPGLPGFVRSIERALSARATT